jgi:hypothetical protein
MPPPKPCPVVPSSRRVAVRAKRPDTSDDVSRAFQCVSVSRLLAGARIMMLRQSLAPRQRMVRAADAPHEPGGTSMTTSLSV